MKKLLSIILLAGISVSASSQTDSTMQTFVDSVCSCLSKVDMNTIKTKSDAQMALSGLHPQRQYEPAHEGCRKKRN